MHSAAIKAAAAAVRGARSAGIEDSRDRGLLARAEAALEQINADLRIYAHPATVRQAEDMAAAIDELRAALDAPAGPPTAPAPPTEPAPSPTPETDDEDEGEDFVDPDDIDVDLEWSQSSSQIRWCWRTGLRSVHDEDEEGNPLWQSTPFQRADVRDDRHARQLIAAWLG